ncbi:MAG TPA: rod shape-determining protein MreC [Clostridiales bacterium]|nr:rod shape-determining protein MreC [Clostridiales bacterium]
MPRIVKKRPLFIIIIISIMLITLMVVTNKYEYAFSKIEGAVGYITSPVQKVFYTISSSVSNFFYDIKDNRDIKAENEELREYVAILENELIEKNELEKENKRLKKLLDFAVDNDKMTVTGAKVIGKNPGNWFNVILIDKGTKHGVDINMAVVTERGLVGRIFQVGPNWAKVRTIVDGQSSVSGIIERTRDNGLVKGNNDMGLEEGMCRMIYLPLDSDLKPGDKVLTSGLGEIFPKGIYIGEVKEVVEEKRDFFKTAIIEPGVDFQRLEEVLVIKKAD